MAEYTVDPNPGEGELATLKRILAATGGSGSGGNSLTPGVAYVATNGNDATAQIGNQGLPFLTAQAAYNAAAGPAYVVLQLGVGTFGGIALSADWDVRKSIVGMGPNASHLGGINGNGLIGVDATVDGSGTLTSFVGNGNTGFAITLTASNVDLGTVSSNGGNGGNVPAFTSDPNYYDFGQGGDAGSGGTINLTLDDLSLVVPVVAGGNAGTEPVGGAQGANGTGGTIIVSGGIINGPPSIQGGSGDTSYQDGNLFLDSCLITAQYLATSPGNNGLMIASRSRWINNLVSSFLSSNYSFTNGTFVDNGGNAIA